MGDIGNFLELGSNGCCFLVVMCLVQPLVLMFSTILSMWGGGSMQDHNIVSCTIKVHNLRFLMDMYPFVLEKDTIGCRVFSRKYHFQTNHCPDGSWNTLCIPVPEALMEPNQLMGLVSISHMCVFISSRTLISTRHTLNCSYKVVIFSCHFPQASMFLVSLTGRWDFSP